MKCYLVAFVPEAKGYSLFSPDFPGFASQGDTIEECMIMATDCLNICIEACINEKRDVPEPCSLEKAREIISKKLSKLGAPEMHGVFFQYVPVIIPDNTLIRVSISMTKSDLEEIDYRANLFGMKRSKFLVAAAKAFREKDADGE